MEQVGSSVIADKCSLARIKSITIFKANEVPKNSI